MARPTSERPEDTGPNRRNFLHAGTAAVVLGGAGMLQGHARAGTRSDGDEAGGEWRNRQAGMAYRPLGRTGLMISEVVSGGDPITLENYRHLELALEMGLNYLDMAPAYNKGETERAYGKLLAASAGRRGRVFLTTKVSDFNSVRTRMYRQLLEKLPESKQAAIREKARVIKESRHLEEPGYFLTYFPGQKDAFESAYLRAAMQAEYGAQVEGSRELRDTIVESIEGSLERVGTDHFDILMCPHGADLAEDLASPEIHATFEDLKRQGKVRFLGVTSHNDPAGVLRAAADAGHYDVAMVAYNVINGGYVDESIRHAATKGLGVIAMKAAHAVATHHKPLQPVPEWRVQKVERIVPGDLKAPQKAYLWALQNPRISAVISNLWDETFVKDNLKLAGKKVTLQPA
ncbi:Aldo/keto reductase family protein [Aquisphaera giovannonii]|uniref:Aldo/keto reductase family protein n=1 Tax=Aquisphaera giovannonii TaxID=406548 RepID=A0A5B9W8U1_9BACT|nr:aldo/keto reductase [Aquisphaera giovannonii]QEH36933.1 Aldo/keto reductase family protein [Aquisphaera giovannonii]